MGAGGKLQERLDEIYGGDPGEFTKRRDELAKSLRADGDGELAAAVKKLKRPTQAAAAINRLSLGRPDDIGRVLEAGAELRAAQAELGKAGAGDRLKAAAADQREAITAVLAIAADELGSSGATLDRISETLHATAGDEALAETVGAGRIEREGQAAGLGGALVPPPGGAAKRKPAKAAKGSKRGDAREGKKAAAAAARKRRAAEAKLEKTATKLEAAEAKEAAARDRVAALERELRAAASTLDGAEKALARARDAAAKAQRELDELSG